MKGLTFFSAFVILALCLAQLEARNAPLNQLQDLKRDVSNNRRIQNEFSRLERADSTTDTTTDADSDTTTDATTDADSDNTTDAATGATDATTDADSDNTTDAATGATDATEPTDAATDPSNPASDSSNPASDSSNPATVPSKPATDTSSIAPSDPEDPGLTGGEIAGIVIGTLAGVALIGGGIYYLYMKKMLCFENV